MKGRPITTEEFERSKAAAAAIPGRIRFNRMKMKAMTVVAKTSKKPSTHRWTTLLALLVFGYTKGQFTTARPLRSAWQTVIVRQ